MIETIGREEFIGTRFDYRAGEHVTVLGPTGSGKTELGYHLLEASATVDLPAIMFIMKPKDETADRWIKKNNYKKVTTWPPSLMIMQKKPAGYALWPKHTFNPELDDMNMEHQFRAAILDSYKRGNRIVFADEVAGLVSDLKLEKELKALWSRGRSMGTGLWAASQRPFQIPLHAYSQAHHLFLFRDPDKRSRQRFGEISGVDPYEIDRAVLGLDEFQCLYIRQRGPRLCIVDAQ